MNEAETAGARPADDRPGPRRGPGGWWQGADGYWYPPPAPRPADGGGADPTATTGQPPPPPTGDRSSDPTAATWQPLGSTWAASPAADGAWMAPPPDGTPRAPGMAEVYRSWPRWARIGGPIAAGGSGNGPAYVSGPINVIGPDVYGLDSDHDGIGCESS